MQQFQPGNQYTGAEIAIIGMAGRFPGARRVEEFWRNLHDGVESLTVLTDEEILSAGTSLEELNSPNYVKAGMILENADKFDAAFFGYNPREAEVMDPQQRIFLECAWEALEDAGYALEQHKRAVGVYAGVGMNTYLCHFSSNPEVMNAVGIYQTMISNDKDFIATRVSYKLNLKGPSFTVQTACSTSLVATHLACQSLLNGECDMALAGGVSIRFPQNGGYMYQADMIHSSDGHCRAFDAKAQGPGGGGGAGIVVLKRLSDALADGDHIYAVVKGSAVNNDGSMKVGFTAPSVEGQAKVITEALAISGVDPSTISFVEAHGTGTALGDPIEIAALTNAYRAYTQEKNFCAVGSVKTNIGHLDTAAGVAGLIKTVLALKHKQIPGCLHFEKPNPKIDFANSPFFVNPELMDWKAGATPRRAGVSSFGMGGTNAHLVLEEAPASDPSEAMRPWQLLVLSAKTAAGLEAATANLVRHFEQHPELDVADAAYTLQVGRKTFSHRRMVVTRDVADALGALKTHDPQRVFTSVQDSSARPVAFMFPGGGAQYVNMGRELYQTEAVFRQEVDRCFKFLKARRGIDLLALLYPEHEPATELSQRMEQTSLALPALFTVEYAMARLLMSWGVRPQAMIGHSLGEYVAACLAGVLTLEDALSIVALRGRLFEQLPPGSMLSVPLSEQELQPFLGQRLSLAAINGPALCVVSGPADAIEELEKTLADNRIEVGHIHIAVAAHSEMVTPILAEFVGFLETIKLKPPAVPFVSNLTGTWITDEEATDPGYWARHLRHTVRFGEGLRTLWEGQDRILLEVGPGQTLSTLARQHADKPAGQVVLRSLRHPHEQESDVSFLLNAAGRLWLTGAQVDWQGLYVGEKRRRMPLPTYPFNSQRYWLEASNSQTNPGFIPAARAAGKKPDAADWFYLPSWKRSLLRAPARAAAGEAGQPQQASPWLIFADASGFGAQVSGLLKEDGQRVVTVEAGSEFAAFGENHFVINPSQPEDYRALLRALRERDQLPHQIIHAWSVSPLDPARPETELPPGRLALGFDSLLLLAQVLEKEGVSGALEITVLSNGAHDVTGDEPLCPSNATVLSPCLVIPQEYPNITCRSIDIVLPAADAGRLRSLAERVVGDLRAGPSDLTVAYRNSHRWVQAFEPVDPGREDAPPRLREEGVYLIIGGLGGVGYILATYLAQTARARLILTGRSALPDRDAWEDWLSTHDETDAVSRNLRRMLALEEAGAEVLALVADVADREQMRRVLEQADARFGALNGVIHAAGASKEHAFRTIHETVGNDNPWFAPKVHGLFVLEEVLRDAELDFCLLSSSLSSILGGLGHVEYTASNLFMDAFTRRHNRRGGGVTWTSVNWEGWQLEAFGEVSNLASGLLELRLDPAEGMKVLGRILAAEPVAQIAISTGTLQSRIDKWVRRNWLLPTEEAQATIPASLHPRPELLNPYVAPATDLQREIVPLWQLLIGVEEIGIYDNFFELGGSSLLATQLISRLRDKFQVELTLRGFFEAPTVAALAATVEQARTQGLEPPPPAITRIPREAHGALLSAEGALTVPDYMKAEHPLP